MTDLALRPRTSTELVDTAFQVYRRDPSHFIVAAALVYVPWLVLRLAFDIGVSTGVPTVSQTLWAGVAGLLVYSVVGGVTTAIARDVYFDHPVGLAAAFRAVAARIGPLIGTTMVTFTFMVIGALLLLLPALYPLARFFAARQVVMLEDAGVGKALSRSSELSVGMKRHILNTLLLVGLLTLAISVGVGMIASLISSRVLVHVVSTALSIVVYPFFGITETLLYYDVRIRKEGFDIEYLASGGAPMTTPTVDPF